eukprot:CAMPEP_0185756204 /NCGR_PEP_ID=MMETSP1174-20130828/14629_1 /TAXON_ID=35687 /ORGANISM="Dictyocha speculum, Strain CCMP1381" /LENGTH=129 /DNA_ID=CAMNT_0028435065 /DNA_START=439 /DNA_END=827 /DNA_ORIENTATION=+
MALAERSYEIVDSHVGDFDTIVVTGPPWAATDAALSAEDLAANFSQTVLAYTFGKMRQGNVEYAAFADGLPDLHHHRVSHALDPVPRECGTAQGSCVIPTNLLCPRPTKCDGTGRVKYGILNGCAKAST